MPPDTMIGPRVIDTALGPVQIDLTEGAGPVVLASHAGIGGIDQARLMLDWLPTTDCRQLLVSRPGYLDTPLVGLESFERQADLFAARHPDRVTALVAIASVSGHYANSSPNCSAPNPT